MRAGILLCGAALFSALPLFALLPSGLPDEVARISEGAPAWAKEPNVFPNMSETPFSRAFFESNALGGFAKNKFFPFIDRFGQFIHSDWGGKIVSEADFAARAKSEEDFLERNPRFGNLDEYGGVICGVNFGKSERFSVRKIGGKWFFITPAGNPFFLFGINSVAQSTGTRIDGREHFFAPDAAKNPNFVERYKFDRRKSDFYNFERQNISLKYPDKFAYFDTCKKRIYAWGMNTVGSWSNPEFTARARLPFVALVESAFPPPMESLSGGKVPDYFDPNFESAQEKLAAAQKRLLDSEFCVGAFVGYKLFWQYKDGIDIPRAVLTSPAKQPAKKAFMRLLGRKYGDIQNLNADWNAQYKSWDEFLQTRSFVPSTPAAEGDMREFKLAYYAAYFESTQRAFKKAVPKTLYMGCRFQLPPEPDMLSVAAQYCDVVSFVWYADSAEKLSLPSSAPDKPVLIAEFNFCAPDRGVFGGGFCPRKSTRAQVAAFENYIESAFANPAVAGALWMRWSDSPTAGKHNGENTASGFVDVCDTPVYPLCAAARKMGAQISKIPNLYFK